VISPPTRLWRPSRLVPLAALAIVGLAACGGGSSKATPPAATTPTTAAPTSTSGSDTTDTNGFGRNNAQLAGYRQCLTDQGINVNFGGGGGGRRGPNGTGSTVAGETPSSATAPSTPPSSIDQAKLQAAAQACKDKLPAGMDLSQVPTFLGGTAQGGFGGFGGGANGANAQAFQAYTSCLRDHGVDVPTSVAGQQPGQQGGGPRPTFDTNSPTFQAANKICQVLLPQRNGPNNSTTTTAQA